MPNLVQRAGEYGIENLKLAIAGLAKQIARAVQIDSNNDGKIDLTEGIAFALGGATDIAALFLSLRAAVPEGKDLDEAEFTEIVDYLASLDLFPNRPNVEAFVDKTLLAVNYNRRYIREASEFFKTL